MLPTTVQQSPSSLQGFSSTVPLSLVRSPNPTRASKLPHTISTACLNPKGGHAVACEHGAVVWRPNRCKRCLPCLEARRSKVICRAVAAMGQLKWVAFVTVTSVSGGNNPKANPSWPTMMAWWSRLVAWLRRQYGPMEFMVVKESGHQTGMKHLHAFFSNWVWVPDYLLQAKWESISGAYNCKIIRIWGSKVAAYVSKYLSKGLASGIALKKLVTYSRGFPKLPTAPMVVLDRWPGSPRPDRWLETLRDGTLVFWWGEYGKCTCFGEINRLE